MVVRAVTTSRCSWAMHLNRKSPVNVSALLACFIYNDTKVQFTVRSSQVFTKLGVYLFGTYMARGGNINVP